MNGNKFKNNILKGQNVGFLCQENILWPIPQTEEKTMEKT